MWTLTALAAFTLLAQTPAAETREAVLQAANDYADVWDRGRPELVERSVSRKLVLYAFECVANADCWVLLPGFHQDLHAGAVRTSKRQEESEKGSREIEVLDLRFRTALAKVTGTWGVHCLQICQEGDGWRIRQVLVQSPRREIAVDVRVRIA